jgi:hypothetical protein
MDKSEIDQLKSVNRDLAFFLKEQLEYVLILNRSVQALQKLVEEDSALSTRYKVCLQSVKSSGLGLPNPQRLNQIGAMLQKVARDGTL